MKLSSIRIDTTKANEGTWGTYFGGKFLIARYNSTAADELRQKHAIENLELLQSETPEGEAKGKEIDAIVLAETILLDWQNVTDDNDVEIPFSKEKALELILNPEYAEWTQFIKNHSVNRASYLASTEEVVTEQVKPTAAS